jgi:anti-sigma B factor antagonist
MNGKDLTVRGCDGYVVVALRGELDLANAAHVVAELTAAAANQPKIVADLTGLEFIDCRGVAALASARDQAREANGDLLLAAPQRQVLRVLAATRPFYSFAIYSSAEEAASSIATLTRVKTRS